MRLSLNKNLYGVQMFTNARMFTRWGGVVHDTRTAVYTYTYISP